MDQVKIDVPTQSISDFGAQEARADRNPPFKIEDCRPFNLEHAMAGFAADNHASSEGRSERAARVLRSLSGACGWGFCFGLALMFVSVVAWLWRVMP